jgi:hypothetical protein
MSSEEKVTVAYFFSIEKKNIPFAFLSMALEVARHLRLAMPTSHSGDLSL